MARRKKGLRHTLHRYFFPHRSNQYNPRVFALHSVTVVLAVLIVVFSIYVTDIKIAEKGGFFASVLPAALTTLANADREAVSVQGLEQDALLAKAAQLKADDMAAKGYFSHKGPDGALPWEWLNKVGYEYSYAGENLAIDFVDSKDVESAWMASPAHHANIVKPNYTKIGIGVANGIYQGHETTFVVEFFAAPAHVAVASIKPSTPVKAAAAADARVLGADTGPAKAPAPTVIEKVVAAPTHALAYALAALLTFLLGLFGIVIAVHAHLRKRSIEMMSGGIVLAGIVAACLIYVTSDPGVVLPQDAQSASAVNAISY